MTIEKIDDYVNECLRWSETDLFWAWCRAKGIEDPEGELTDEEYASAEQTFAGEVTYDFLRNLVDSVSQDVNERIEAAFG